MDDSQTTMREFEMIRQLRRTVGLFDGAMPISPKDAWEEAIWQASRLQDMRENLRAVISEAQRVLDVLR